MWLGLDQWDPSRILWDGFLEKAIFLIKGPSWLLAFGPSFSTALISPSHLELQTLYHEVEQSSCYKEDERKNHTGESLASFWKDLESSRTSLNSCDSLRLPSLGLVVRCRNQSPIWLIYWLGFCCAVLSRFSCVRLFAVLWTIAHQVALSMGFSRQEYWSGLPCPHPGDLPDPGIEPVSLTSPALVGGKPEFCYIKLNAILQATSWHMFSEFRWHNRMATSVPAQPRPLGPHCPPPPTGWHEGTTVMESFFFSGSKFSKIPNILSMARIPGLSPLEHCPFLEEANFGDHHPLVDANLGKICQTVVCV